MNSLLKSIVIKIILLSLFLVVTSMILATFYPIIGNELAMEQLENNTYGYVAFETWLQFLKIFNIIKFSIIGILSGSIAVDIVKYFKTGKEK